MTEAPRLRQQPAEQTPGRAGVRAGAGAGAGGTKPGSPAVVPTRTRWGHLRTVPTQGCPGCAPRWRLFQVPGTFWSAWSRLHRPPRHQLEPGRDSHTHRGLITTDTCGRGRPLAGGPGETLPSLGSSLSGGQGLLGVTTAASFPVLATSPDLRARGQARDHAAQAKVHADLQEQLPTSRRGPRPGREQLRWTQGEARGQEALRKIFSLAECRAPH